MHPGQTGFGFGVCIGALYKGLHLGAQLHVCAQFKSARPSSGLGAEDSRTEIVM